MATGGGRRRRERRGRRRREKREEKEQTISFPEDIIVEILKRLPVESLLRFTSVCKSWYSLITSPSFIAIHFKQQTASCANKSLVLLRDTEPSGKVLYSVHLDDETFEKRKSLNFSVRCLIKGMYFLVVGCVNGVVCLSDDLVPTYTRGIALWNPSIRKFVFLPPPLIAFENFDHTVRFGFGFDDTINDFKVVRVVYLGLWSRTPRVEIYEPRVGSWREVDSKKFSHRIDKLSRQVFLQGNVHWVVGCKFYPFKLPNTKKNLIVLFKLRTETFGTMEVPDVLNECELQPDFCISALGGSLSLIHYASTDHGNTCCLWVMKQYGVTDSWAKLFHLDLREAPCRVFGFRRNGAVLVQSQSLLFSIEPKSKQGKILRAFRNWDWKLLYVDSFVESLALLGAKGQSPDEECELESPSELDAVSGFQEPDNSPIHRSPVEVLVHWFG